MVATDLNFFAPKLMFTYHLQASLFIMKLLLNQTKKTDTSMTVTGRFLQCMHPLTIGILVVLSIGAPFAQAEQDAFFYCGTYTTRLGHVDGKAEAIGIYALDKTTGKIRPLGLSPPIANSSHLCLSKDSRFLYSISEITEYEGKEDGCLTVFSVDAENKQLTQIQKVSSHGPGPAYLSLDRTGRFLLCANYVAGNVVVYPLASDGVLGTPTANVMHSGKSVNADRQEAPHPHAIVASPDNRFVFVPDLGIDQIVAYQFDESSGKLTARPDLNVDTPPGSGPRHFVFLPSGKWAFVSLELSSEVAVYSYESGKLTEAGRYSTVPDDYDGLNHCAEIRASADEKNVYVSNRGHDSIAVYSINSSTGRLNREQIAPTQGRTPRNFAISPDDNWLVAANQDSHSLLCYSREQSTGKIQSKGNVLDSPSPVLICFFPE